MPVRRTRAQCEQPRSGTLVVEASSPSAHFAPRHSRPGVRCGAWLKHVRDREPSKVWAAIPGRTPCQLMVSGRTRDGHAADQRRQCGMPPMPTRRLGVCPWRWGTFLSPMSARTARHHVGHADKSQKLVREERQPRLRPLPTECPRC